MVELAAVLVLVVGLWVVPGVVVFGAVGMWMGGMTGAVIGVVIGFILLLDQSAMDS